jgi:hypothetical protein
MILAPAGFRLRALAYRVDISAKTHIHDMVLVYGQMAAQSPDRCGKITR